MLEANGEAADKVDLWKAAYISNAEILDNVTREKRLQDELNAITSGKRLHYYDSNNTLKEGRVAGHSVTNFEAILPPIYATQFGLRKGDTLAMIL